MYNSRSSLSPSPGAGIPAITHYAPDPVKNRLSYEYPYNLDAHPDAANNIDKFPSPPKKQVEPLINPLTGQPTPPPLKKGSGGGGGSPNGPGMGVASWLEPGHEEGYQRSSWNPETFLAHESMLAKAQQMTK